MSSFRAIAADTLNKKPEPDSYLAVVALRTAIYALGAARSEQTREECRALIWQAMELFPEGSPWRASGNYALDRSIKQALQKGAGS